MFKTHFDTKNVLFPFLHQICVIVRGILTCSNMTYVSNIVLNIVWLIEGEATKPEDVKRITNGIKWCKAEELSFPRFPNEDYFRKRRKFSLSYWTLRSTNGCTNTSTNCMKNQVTYMYIVTPLLTGKSSIYTFRATTGALTN